jgi:heat shock protein HtpX
MPGSSQTVKRFADKAGIGDARGGIYEGAPNAFATGAFKNSALVAVSTGLLQSMNREEVEAVIGHEVAHVANGDMVTMTLIQGVMNTFVVFLSRVIGYIVDKVLLRNQNEGPGIGYYVTTIVLDILLGLWPPSSWPGSRASASFAPTPAPPHLMGRKQPMINALARLGGMEPGELPKTSAGHGHQRQTQRTDGAASSHPPIEDRIRALQQAQ